MGKRILLSVFGGIAVLGLVLAIVGFAMGGRSGSVTVNDGQFLFYNSGESIRFGRAPNWMNGMGHWTLTSIGHFGNGSPTSVKQEYRPSGKVKTAAPPVDAGELSQVDVDIEGGLLLIEAGAEPSLSVDGPLEYETYYSDGVWHVRSRTESLRWNRARVWLNGKDVTTTFILTLPQSLDKLTVNLDVGSATVLGLSLRELDINVNAADFDVTEVEAGSAKLEVNAGDLRVSGFMGRQCNLLCNAGSIEFEGDVAEGLNAECSVGHINITVPRPAGFSWNTSTNLGSVRIDGEHYEAGFVGSSSGGGRDAKPHFELECNMGDIELNFI